MENRICIGLPQAFLYYRWATLWRTFFGALGMDVVSSGKTNKEILEQGTALSVDEACLCAKIYLGHVKALIGNCDYILVPRVSNFGYKRNMCTRFEALPDIVRNVFRDTPQQFLTYNIDEIHKEDEKTAFQRLGQQLGADRRAVKKAYAAAKSAEQKKWKQLVAGQEQLYKKEGIRILVAAHSYLIEDAYMGRPVMEMLRNFGVTPIRADIVERETAVKDSVMLSPTLKWEVSREIVGNLITHRDRIDGIVLLSAFPCGPDSMVNEIILRRVQGLPILNLTLDAQSGIAGVETRLESFVDIIRFKEGTL